MINSMQWAIIKKDLRNVTTNKQVFTTMLIVVETGIFLTTGSMILPDIGWLVTMFLVSPFGFPYFNYSDCTRLCEGADNGGSTAAYCFSYLSSIIFGDWTVHRNTNDQYLDFVGIRLGFGISCGTSNEGGNGKI